MNQQNISKPPDLLVKRKRGRPRKDESMPRNVKQHTQPPLAMAVRPPPPPQPAIFPASNSNNVSKVDPGMVGQAVTCVIDGIFDNGYLLSACLGPNNTILRGIVFQQGHITPITPINDVAPHVEMCTRGEFPIPHSNPRNPSQVSVPESVCANQPANANPVLMQNYQNTPAIVTGGSSGSIPSSIPQESLRLVEQDNIMQVFEMSKAVEEPQDCDHRGKNEHVVSDRTAENFPGTDTIVHGPAELEPMVNVSVNEQGENKPDGEKPEVVTPVETRVEHQPLMENDAMQQELQEQTGEMSNIDANQDQNQELVVDLSLSNFTEI